MVEKTYRSKAEIAAFLKSLREDAGLSQPDLAAYLGLSQPTISRIESGTRAVALQELGAYADFFALDVAHILNRETSGLVLLRAEDSDAPCVHESVDLFRAVINDFFGARALVT
jgi:transcriptional regulator with XRE-family HTH domain